MKGFRDFTAKSSIFFRLNYRIIPLQLVLQPQNHLIRGAVFHIVPFCILSIAFKFLDKSFSKCCLDPLKT